MARVVVVGGGFGGMAAAARLAKLGHEVTLLERSPRLGGAMSPVSENGFIWDAGPTSMLVPAVVRDLFRKSGRPLEAELGAELEPLDPLREHRFEDSTSVRITGGSRAAQLAAFEEMGKGLGQQWVDYVDSFADDWEVLRRHYFEEPWTPDALPKGGGGPAGQSGDAAQAPAPDLPRRPAVHGRRAPLRRRGSRVAQRACLERPARLPRAELGAWRVPASAGGMAGLTAALEARLATRGVTVVKDVEARDLVIRDGAGRGADPRAATMTPTSWSARSTRAGCPPWRLRRPDDAGDPAGDPLPRPEGEVPDGAGGRLPRRPDAGGPHRRPAPAGGAAWTLIGRGKLAEDIVVALARKKIDVREQVETRIDRSPRDLVEEWGGSPLGVLWQGRGTLRNRLGPTTPIPNVYAAGAHAAPGSGLPFVGLSAALVAQTIGPA